MPAAAITGLPDNFGDICLTKAILRKYLKDNCSSELYLQLSLKYFADICFILKLFPKTMTDPEDTGRVDLQQYLSELKMGSSWTSLSVYFVKVFG